MTSDEYVAEVERILADAGVQVAGVQERSYPGERWLIVTVAQTSLAIAQSMAGEIEEALNDSGSSEAPFAVTFRPEKFDSEVNAPVRDSSGGRLASRHITQLIELLEARSRTSDALPSLKYVEDPRASLAAVAASRHQLIYGRRGVGKTSLLLEAKRLAERDGHIAAWMNAHVFRQLDAPSAFLAIAETVLSLLARYGGGSKAKQFSQIQDEWARVSELRLKGAVDDVTIGTAVAGMNQALRAVLRPGVVRLYVFLDDFYLIPARHQPVLLDFVAGMLRDCDGWLKVASIERLTRPYEPSSRLGLEVPHDASKIDLDITLEDPAAAQSFLEAVLGNYTAAVGVKRPSAIAKTEALGRLVLASGGVPRDYLNLFASSIVAARKARSQPQEVGREDVAKAAGLAARDKKRDLEQDVSSEASGALLGALEALSSWVQGQGYTYFRVNMTEKNQPPYETLARLVDLRFVHLVQAALSDQHRAGIKYEAYVLDLSEYTDVRLKRWLDVLDLENGQWTRRLTGSARQVTRLTGTQFRDRLRQSPLVELNKLIG